jgi:hypothetical protein
VRIDILVVADCPHRAAARARVQAAVDRAGIAASVREVEVATTEDAVRLGMRGSPTILVDGRDPFGDAEPSLSCRLYRAGGGFDGAPSVERLVAALM